MSPVAAIDCGTNSIRLLIAEPDADGQLSDVERDMQIVRLGQGVDATGRLSPQALQRTETALADYRRRITAAGCDSVRMVATSASRDASNGADFTRMVTATLGQQPEVITGWQEAQLSFAGATTDAVIRAEATPPFLVVDIGGGSTELIAGSEPEEVTAYSMDIGSVRLTERCLHDDPPTAPQRSEASSDAATALDQAAARVDLAADYSVIGVAGTLTTLAALDLGLAEYDSEAVHGHVLSARAVAELADRLLAQTAAQRREQRVIHPGRVDVIGAGALIAAAVMRRLGCDFLQVSERDILDGIAFSLLPGSGTAG